MSLKQLNVFVENKKGALVEITETLASHDVNIRALSIADTEEFGILRLIVNDNETATKVLAEREYSILYWDAVLDGGKQFVGKEFEICQEFINVIKERIK